MGKIKKNTLGKFEISRDEWVIIGSVLVLAALLIVFLPKTMSSQWFTNLIPPLQYLIYNMGFILLTVIIFGVPISLIFKRDMPIWTMVRSGLSSWLVFSFILDLWQPPFAFGTSGEYLITSQESLIGTSVDYMVGWIYMRLFPTNSMILNIPIIGKLSMLFVLTYFITPILATFIIALLLKPKVFAKLLSKK